MWRGSDFRNTPLIILDYQSQLYLTSALPLSFPIPPTSSLLSSFPPPAFATRFTQTLLYCCLTEFDTETEAQAGGKTQWAADKPRPAVPRFLREASVVSKCWRSRSPNAGKQGLSWTEWRGAGSQRFWGLLLPGQVKRRPDISKRDRNCKLLLSSENAIDFSTEIKECVLWVFNKTYFLLKKNLIVTWLEFKQCPVPQFVYLSKDIFIVGCSYVNNNKKCKTMQLSISTNILGLVPEQLHCEAV